MCNCNKKTCWQCDGENKPVPHKHAELIKAWADGAKIQHFAPHLDMWADITAPAWNTSCDYRIKPEPKPDSETKTGDSIWNGVTGMRQLVELKYTFDGETGKLKSVEII